MSESCSEHFWLLAVPLVVLFGLSLHDPLSASAATPTLLVADTGNHRIEKFDVTHSARYIRLWTDSSQLLGV